MENNEHKSSSITQTLQGNDEGEMLHKQLFCYAEDLQQMIVYNNELEDRYQQLNALIIHSHDMHILTSFNGTILQSNAAVKVLGLPQQLIRTRLHQWVSPSSYEKFTTLLTVALENKSPHVFEGIFTLQRSDESEMLVSARILSVCNEDKQQHLHWIMRDITDLRKTDFEVQLSSMALQNATEGVMITDPTGTIIAVNQAFTRITGYSGAEAVGCNASLLSSGLQDAGFYKGFWHSLCENGSWQGGLLNKRKDGEIYMQNISISAIRNEEKIILRFIAFLFDQSQTEKNLSYLAHHDSLTGLPNRLLLQDRMKQMLSQARRCNIKFTLLFIDLDGFKQINDRYGHEMGDRVLIEVTSRLSASVREIDTVARLGGDEFVILAKELSGDTHIAKFCKKVISMLSEPILIDGLHLAIGGSFGCAEFPRHGEDEAVLLKNSDAAMYQAKESGGNTYVIYQQNGRPQKK